MVAADLRSDPTRALVQHSVPTNPPRPNSGGNVSKGHLDATSMLGRMVMRPD